MRSPGDWPGKDIFNKFSQLPYVVTLLALLSALVLIGNTMTTLVGEQTREIGSMKAIGGESTYLLGGAFNCGKGQPGQVAAVSHGCPAAVFEQVNVLNSAKEAGR